MVSQQELYVQAILSLKTFAVLNTHETLSHAWNRRIFCLQILLKIISSFLISY